MAPKSEKPAEPPESGDEAPEEEPQAGPLVPMYGVPAIARGIQAFRRGDIILYTVRGEPKEVLELMGQLDKQGVGEVVALISHHAEDVAFAPEDDAQQEQEEGGRQ